MVHDHGHNIIIRLSFLLYTDGLPMDETTTMLPLTTTTTPISPTTFMDQVHPTTDAQTPLLTTEGIVTSEHQTVSSMAATDPSTMVLSNETTMPTTSTMLRLTTPQGICHESLLKFQ